MDGTLLFREDFGGNDPNDPVAGNDPAPGMTSSYTQIFDTATCIAQFPCTGMGSGRYLLTKIGYRNASTYTYSHWFIMDDHTYPNDYTRGYLLEIDGRTDNATLFETVIDGLCEGSKLTFSAYVTNITTAHSYNQGNNGDPQLSFVLLDPETGAELTTPYKTGPIPVDRSYENMPGEWRNSAHWNLVGMNFTVPSGRTAIKLVIKNACTSSGGNDFAIDDIEIRLCVPPVTITGETEVCPGTSTTLTADFSNDGTFPEPLVYKWWFSTDSLTWTEQSETSNVLTIPTVQNSDYGWYKAAVAGHGNIERVNCRAQSEPFHLTVKNCDPQNPELCMDGTLLYREDFGGNDPEDPRVKQTPAPGMTYGQLKDDTYGLMGSGRYIVTKSGYCNGDTTGWTLPDANQSILRSQWYIQDDHTYPGDYTRGYFLEIDGNGGSSRFYETEIYGLCADSKLTFSAYVANVYTMFQYNWYSQNRGEVVIPCLKFVLTNSDNGEILASKETDKIPFDASLPAVTDWQYSSEWHLVGMNFTVPPGVEGIRLSIYNNVTNGTGNDFAIDDIEIRLCAPPVSIDGENEICANETATLTADFTNDGTFDDPLEYKWLFSADSITWTEQSETSNVLTIPTVQNSDYGWYKAAVAGQGNIERVNCRAQSEPFLLKVKDCESPITPCPDLRTITADTTVCDTLLPYRWRDTLFTEPARYEILYKDQHDCDSVLLLLTLDTVHCEREEPPTPPDPPTPPGPEFYPLIVNKYNWVLLLDNVTFSRLFPDRFARNLQWFRNEEPIPGANDDDYSEYKELHGRFQLRLDLDNDQTIWSNILEINLTEPVEQQIRISIYDSRGMPVREDQVTHGIYLYRYEQGEQVWTEKKLIP